MMTRRELELLDRDRILAGLTDTARARIESAGGVSGHRFHQQPICWAQARQGWPSGAVCLAEQQTAGRGRQGRDWLSPFGASLAFRCSGASRCHRRR
ncbi:MAG: hypothetical protein MZV65_41475 [Chromatiales bacterium]|nr:hypothetical protein [Chromatiales bacterium]